jgi:hypothetical protein
MTSMLNDAFNWFVTFLLYVPEPSAWLLLGIFLAVCSTERGRGDSLGEQWLNNSIARFKTVPFGKYDSRALSRYAGTKIVHRTHGSERRRTSSARTAI